MMRNRMAIASLVVAILSASSAASFATETPSPQPSPNAMHAKQKLTTAQKAAVLDAHTIFDAAKTNAQNGFDRALADAQAIRDQAISVAGNNAVGVRAAKKDFRESYNIIYRAYVADLNNAKSILQNSIAAAMAAKKG